MAHKCAVCGKRADDTMELEPSPELPEVTKTMWFCGERCCKAFAARIRRGRKKALRTVLEAKAGKASDTDFLDIWTTLAPKEKEQLAMTGFAVIAARSGGTPSGFYRELGREMRRETFGECLELQSY